MIVASWTEMMLLSWIKKKKEKKILDYAALVIFSSLFTALPLLDTVVLFWELCPGDCGVLAL